MCFLSVFVLFLGCYVSLVHTQWAWNPVGMCLIWKFYPLGLVNSNRRLITVLQHRQECGNGKWAAQRQQRACAAAMPVPRGTSILKISSLSLLCSLLSSLSPVHSSRECLASFAVLYILSIVSRDLIIAAFPDTLLSSGTVHSSELFDCIVGDAMPR